MVQEDKIKEAKKKRKTANIIKKNIFGYLLKPLKYARFFLI
jgi:hypothetical protein